jgi:putative alpha-1,2-mannosidase
MFPGPCLPFGMVKLSPDNQGNSWNGGYEYSVLSISGFSHLHSMALSGLSIMPTTGPIQTDPSSSRLHPGEPDGPFGGMWTAGYRSRLLKETEKASPGYYTVYLMDYKIKVELSTTLRCGFLRFTFPETKQAHILFNLDFPVEETAEVLSVELEQTAPNELVGSVRQRNNYAGEHTYYFIAQFSKPPESIQVWKNEPYTGTNVNYGIQWRRLCRISTLSGKYTGGAGCGLIANYSTTSGEQVIVRTAISFVSVENAQLNLKTEAEPFGWNLDAVVVHAREVWSKILERIEVQGGSEDEKRKL